VVIAHKKSPFHAMETLLLDAKTTAQPKIQALFLAVILLLGIDQPFTITAIAALSSSHRWHFKSTNSKTSCSSHSNTGSAICLSEWSI
jgi:hypothetical protein